MRKGKKISSNVWEKAGEQCTKFNYVTGPETRNVFSAGTQQQIRRRRRRMLYILIKLSLQPTQQQVKSQYISYSFLTVSRDCV